MNRVQVSIRPPSEGKKQGNKPSKAQTQEGKVRKRIEDLLEARELAKQFEL